MDAFAIEQSVSGSSSPTPTNTPTATSTPISGSGDTVLYVSSTSGGTVGGVSFADDDILTYNVTTDCGRCMSTAQTLGLPAWISML
ncbi:MAG: hypothetical protein R2932_57740 [Caldilineaceae bacterium]